MPFREEWISASQMLAALTKTLLWRSAIAARAASEIGSARAHQSNT